jgi:tetratricopeptide (TPR) repeat protein
MHAEREELVKRVFPQLRKLCEQRGVTWGEVDLRWGVTDEQKAEGKVLPICLEEIQRCRPYFIGLLGERYGWVPDEISPDLVEREPWLAEHRHRSVTELEILHGVLNNTKMADHTFFYFRSPSFASSLPSDQQLTFREHPFPEETVRYGPEEAERRAEERRRRLAALKARILASGLPVRENYLTPSALGELVLQDLSAVIDRLYPEGSQPDPLDREAAEHEVFAQSRARVYIGRQEDFDRLDAHAHGDGPPLVVLGESGSGKSALLANWAIHYRASFQDRPPQEAARWKKLAGLFQSSLARGRAPLVITHFIGASPYSADWMAMLRRIMGEFKRRFDIQQGIPDQPDALRAAFANWLHMAAARGRVVLILDALNQLEDRDGAPDLVWLPPVIPANVRLIVSTLPSRSLQDLAKRGWPTLNVEPLTPVERARLIKEYLAQYTKTLSPDRAERIGNARQCTNPLYLRALLDELRVYGDHLTLGQRIDDYLSAPTVADLYAKILERYEQDYDRDRPGLVRDAMCLLWASRRGLAEVELLDLLGSNGAPLPRARWSPLYLAAEQSFVSRSGLIGFFHDYLRQAVRRRYLATEEERRSAHLRLADYFEARDLGPRRIDELPWQLAEAEAWQTLVTLLADPAFFDATWDANQFELKAYWARAESSSPLEIVDAYRPVLDGQTEGTSHVWRVASLLNDTGHPVEALLLRERLVEHFRRTGDRASLAGSLGGQALILEARGDLDGALALMEEQERLCRELGSKDGLRISLGNQAVILQARGDLDGALALHKEEERLCRELGSKDGLRISLGNQALILQARGDLDGALALHKEQERLCRELGSKDGLWRSLYNQTHLLFYKRNDPRGALPKCEEAIRILIETRIAPDFLKSAQAMLAEIKKKL